MKHFGALLLAFLAFPVLAAPSERPRIGLVLGGGGAKGFAHIPVLKCLDELDIPIDYVAGTSAGGVVGALYAAGYSGSEIERIGRAIDWFDFFTDRPHRSLLPFLEKNEDGRYQLEFFLRGGVPTAPSGLLHGQKFTQLFSALTFPLPGDLDFDRLPIPFRCVAVDLITGQQVVLRKGSLVKAMRATMAVPTMFSPVEWGDYLLMDGGVLNNLPVDVVKDMGADIVIAVDLGSPLFEKEELNSADKILTQTLRIVEIEQTSQKRQTADILIIPDMKGVGSLDYFFSDKLSTIFERGEAAAREILPALAALKEKYGLKRLEETGASPAIQRQKKFILEQVTVRGNEKLPASFISRSFGLRRGEPVDGRTLDRRVTELYALGYFENVQCSVYPLEGDRLDIELSVKEVPRGKLRVGLGYDNFRKLVVATGVVLTHLPLPGIRL
ncbi:MAG: hypothetical protein FJY81_02820, partial [Candidatus Aminicenantes bacterium]|nr:hypothetical protein [Candidatus Aminicenantes bacterium]